MDGIVDCDFPSRVLKKELKRLAPDLNMASVERYWRENGYPEDKIAMMRWAPRWIALSWNAYKHARLEWAKAVLVSNGYEFVADSGQENGN